jgi:hypothetical protein
MRVGMAISNMRNTAIPDYSAVRVSTTSDIQLQNTATSHYITVRTHTMSDRYTLTPHYGYGRTRTPPCNLVYHRLIPQYGLSYYHHNTH